MGLGKCFCEHRSRTGLLLIVVLRPNSYDDDMQTPFRAIVELGCQCGERLELPIEDARAPFDCPVCDHEHVLDEAQLVAIEDAFGRALIEAHRLQMAEAAALPAAALRH
jgi:hypothetical protein